MIADNEFNESNVFNYYSDQEFIYANYLLLIVIRFFIIIFFFNTLYIFLLTLQAYLKYQNSL